VYCATKWSGRSPRYGGRNRTDHRSFLELLKLNTSTTTDAQAAQWLEEFRRSVIPADAIARAIAFAIEQPADVDVNEIVVRPIGQS